MQAITENLFAEPRTPSAPVILRPYQEAMIAAWEGFLDGGGQRGLIVAATGTGKTTVFASIIGRGVEADDGYSALILAHSRELLYQAAGRVRDMYPGIDVGIEAGELRCLKGTQVAVGSVQTLGQSGSTRLSWLGPQMVICDEGHHAAAATYQNVFRRFGCYEPGGSALLGVTATPHRLDNKALIGDKDRAIFESIVFRYDIVQAIRDGFLVELRGYRAAADIDLSNVRKSHGDYVEADLEKVVNVHPVTELAFKSWAEVASDRPTIIFCAGVSHAQAVADFFRAHDVSAEAIYGDMPQLVRQQAIERFQRGETRILTNCNILTEGFDAQACGCVILLRPTQSWSLFTQMVGRGLRTLPGIIDGIGEPTERRDAVRSSRKPDCVVIDIVSNTAAHSLAGAPNTETVPSLQALVGLPSALDLEGRTLAEAVDEFESLPEPVKAAAFRRQTSFSGLTAVLTQVEMLSELEVPQEAEDAGVSLYWLKVGDLRYQLPLGSDSEIARTAALYGDMLGNWKLELVSKRKDTGEILRDEGFNLANAETGRAFAWAEAIVTRSLPGIQRLAGRSAPWRSGAPTERQLKVLRSAGVHEEVLEQLDKGKASAMITMIKNRDGGTSDALG